MLKYLYCILLLNLIISCGKDDAVPVIEVFEEPEDGPVTPPEIGFARYGKAGSDERGLKIFETDEGFISFEYADFRRTNVVANGQWVIRQLDANLKTIDSTLISNEPFISIRDVERFDHNLFAIIGNRYDSSNEPDKRSTVTLINFDGEELKTLVVSDYLTQGDVNSHLISDSFYSNDTLYLSVKNGEGTTLLAIDMDLNLLWERHYNSIDSLTAITFDQNYIFLAYEQKVADESHNIVNILKLDIAQGDEIDRWFFTYSESEKKAKSFPRMMVNDSENVYLLFDFYFPNEGGSKVGIKKIIKATNNIESYVLPDLSDNVIYDIELSNDAIVYIGQLEYSGFGIVKTDMSFNETWKFIIPGGKANDINVLNDGSILFAGQFTKGLGGNSDLFPDTLLGILRADGTIK